MSGSFEPNEKVELQPPKDDPITRAELAKHDGVQSKDIYIGIKGTVFDVSKNTKSYGVGQGYHNLVGKDASRALGKMSLDPVDTNPEVSWDTSSLNDKEKKVVDDWYTFFSKRYNIVGKVSDLPNRGGSQCVIM